MSGGSKGPAPQASYIDPISGKAYWTSEAMNAAIAEREAMQKAESERLKQEQEAKKAQDKIDFTNKLSVAEQNARNEALQYFRDYGVDPTRYSADIEREIAKIKSNILDLDPNPAGAFANNVGADVFTAKTASGTQRALTDFEKLLGINYSQNELGDDLIGGVRDSILNEQFDPLMGSLDNARKRGTLTGTGYQAALDALQGKRAQATSTIDTTANNTLSSMRGSIDDLVTGYKNNIGSLKLPQLETFDPTSLYSAAENKTEQLRGGFGNKVRESIGNTKFVDLTELLNAGGAAQGAHDPTVSGNPIGGGGGFSELAQQIMNNRRSLGSKGAF